jgi:Kef-type K+ transport system membrane component KefB
MSDTYLAYHEPGIVTLLSLTSFLILLNGTRYLLDRFLYCGLIGEILIGIIWGLPVGGTAWLSLDTQHAIQGLGYLGLVGLVFEGGLATDPRLLRKTLFVSVSAATVGLCLPIALSFLLLLFPFTNPQGERAFPTPLAAFSAGASLCSTSLGTTFAILSAAGLQTTEMGTILTGAAMMDDVVGLVMVNIVTTLGEQQGGAIGGWSIARPIVASVGLLLVTLVIAPLLLRPAFTWAVSVCQGGHQEHLEKPRLRNRGGAMILRIPHLSYLLSTFVLIAYVTIAAYVDASVLFAAFLAGGVVTYLWEVVPTADAPADGPPAAHMYTTYYAPLTTYLLVPFFFASIGFSIPITVMFRGSIVWKGIVYTLLMIAGKLAVAGVMYAAYFARTSRLRRRSKDGTTPPSREEERQAGDSGSAAKAALPTTHDPTPAPTHAPGPPHLDALLVGCAMVARGEIGYLIASLAQASGTLQLAVRGGPAGTEGEDVFLVIVWAVTLCTILGPVAVGVLVRRRGRALAE